MKSYLTSFVLHIILIILLFSSWWTWKKPEPVKITSMDVSLVNLPHQEKAASKQPKAKPSTQPEKRSEPEKTVEKVEEKKSEKTPEKISEPKPLPELPKAITEKPTPKKVEEENPKNKPEQIKKPTKPRFNAKEEQALLDEENAQIKQLEQTVSSNSLQIEQEVVMSQYSAYIKKKVERFWTRPLSARNGMQVILRIRLLPGGLVNSVEVDQTSGNAAFDQSAIQAVERAKTLPVPEDTRLFNAYFKQLTLVFRPEDL